VIDASVEDAAGFVKSFERDDVVGHAESMVFVVVAVWGSGPASSAGAQSDSIGFHVVARVADVSVPGASASPTPTG
jgi:hypothetical protein